MDIFCNEQHDLLRQSVRDFAEHVIKPQAQKLDQNEEFSIDITQQMGQQGMLGMRAPKKYGGLGMDVLSYIITVEELARVDGSHAATVAAHNSLGVGPLEKFGTSEQKIKYIPQLCTGDGLWAFGLTEAEAGSDSRASQTKAELKGDNWEINGSKIFITNANTPLTKGVTVQAITDIHKDGRKEISTIIVEKETSGFSAKTMHGKLMWRASNTAELYFDDCKVPEGNILGKRGQGSKIMLSTLDSGRLSIAAMGLGCAQGAYELSLTYAKQRKQFGRMISKYQAISFKLADMATKIELGRNLLYKACWLKQKKRPFGKEAAMAKLYCSEIAKEVADDAVQIHGGYGLMKEYDVERFYRDQRLLQIGEGTSEIQRLVISRHVLGS
ncbi:acyl-CoA dehydrogenase family protein [Reichenbachiella versicolor]|uniref:acyl-CoA dehydrogenase family protein n=1 Tax=Reichenbachiella versicolor TaxID=1821036 RepID=UPI000D6E1209|nr:acyl-CoA dehydrogenase family protein [Reichenbachiella versicolor]